MHPHEVVKREVERQRVGVVLSLLRERVRQPREAAHRHPHREVLPLNVARADVRLVGFAFDAGLLDAGAFGGAVAASRTGSIAVELDELGVVDIGPEGVFYGVQIRLEAVCGQF